MTQTDFENEKNQKCSTKKIRKFFEIPKFYYRNPNINFRNFQKIEIFEKNPKFSKFTIWVPIIKFWISRKIFGEKIFRGDFFLIEFSTIFHFFGK